MKQATLAYCIRENEVLLGMKKRGFGVGKWNGYGGKVNENESILDALVREVKEESGLVISESNTKQIAHLKFFFEDVPIFECHTFLITEWSGIPKETDEMKPQWFAVDTLPYEDMWSSDIHWLPQALSGNKVSATIRFDAKGDTVQEYIENDVDF
ncbi:MAG: hydrolase [Candidatus Kaiserbacteria bacterium]|nr:hydrolase [Candidatus Kaiserbacteria bacterium]